MCETCKHWRAMVKDKNTGMCYCHPPTAGAHGFGIWPMTYRNASCGKWEEK